MLRYARFAREMWHSEVNEAVVGRLSLKRDETAMDIGAGIGAGTMAAARSGANVVAVEPTPYMRRILAIRSGTSKARKRIEIVDGAAEATGVASETIDAAWAVNTMHHWTNMDAAIGELARVLVPGGRVLLVDEDFDDPTHPEYEKFGAEKEDHSHHFEAAKPDAIAAEMRQVGFDVRFAGFDKIANRPAIIIEATRT